MTFLDFALEKKCIWRYFGTMIIYPSPCEWREVKFMTASKQAQLIPFAYRGYFCPKRSLSDTS